MANEKTSDGLAKWASEWLGRPYWYGTACYKCTESLLAAKKRQYPEHYTEGRMSRYRRDVAGGYWAADCIGLAKGYMWWDEALGKTRYAANGCPDKSADGMLEAAKIKGDIADLPEIAGIMLWKPGHVGIYMGAGAAIEARGFDYGVVQSRVGERGWKKWFELPGCLYPEIVAQSDSSTPQIRVTGASVNLRYGPGTEFDIAESAHAGDLFEPVAGVDCADWRAVMRAAQTPDGKAARAALWISARYSEVTRA